MPVFEGWLSPSANHLMGGQALRATDSKSSQAGVTILPMSSQVPKPTHCSYTIVLYTRGRYINCPSNISIAYYIGVLAFLAPIG